LRGAEQKPFEDNRDTDYDVFLTLDSDIVFTPDQVITLIENAKTHGISAGYYMMNDRQHFALVKEWDEEFFLKNGHFQFLTAEDIEKWKNDSKEVGEMMKVDYVGMGFIACTKDVLSNIQYPYFYKSPEVMTTEDGKSIVSLCSEDVAFCKNVQKAGYNIMVDVNLRVGHEKRFVI
jgi:hypothetical protein